MFDLVISDGLCLIGDEFLKCNVGIKDEKICYVGREAIKGEEKINAEGCLVLPGFLNGHTHSAMTVFRGYAEGLPLSNWLEKIWKLEAKLDEKIVYIGAKFACVEMLKNGVTCFVDMYIHMDSV
ncbi:MAG: amidohydrolase family protein, partial [Archaeoglobaceae archaeon]|nr:amidohydrolase family protein [Archaeoglobaceae archaeon]